MFRKMEKQLYIEEFVLPFEGKLRADNRWVKLAKIIPWDTIEDRYAKHFTRIPYFPSPHRRRLSTTPFPCHALVMRSISDMPALSSSPEAIAITD